MSPPSSSKRRERRRERAGAVEVGRVVDVPAVGREVDAPAVGREVDARFVGRVVPLCTVGSLQCKRVSDHRARAKQGVSERGEGVSK